MSDPDPSDAWNRFVEGLRAAGDRLAADSADLDVTERADGYRALLRALNNHLGRFETDREQPELVLFNEWREKMLMDNPDFTYRVADIRDDRSYRLTGSLGDAAFLSITAYQSAGTLEAGAAARIDSDAIEFDDSGGFDIVLGRERPVTGGQWLELPEGASSVWVRHFYDDVANARLGDCRIDALGTRAPSPAIDPARFEHQVRRLGKAMRTLPSLLAGSTKADLAAPNGVRHWEEMTRGAAFTEPGIHYLRGSWQLEAGEALVIEGTAPACRYWSILLYSRFCNSLDHRKRSVSFTGATARLDGDRYRFVVAGTDPGHGHDWLDTEGRRFGLFVLRFLLPQEPPELPTVRVVALSDLESDS